MSYPSRLPVRYLLQIHLESFETDPVASFEPTDLLMPFAAGQFFDPRELDRQGSEGEFWEITGVTHHLHRVNDAFIRHHVSLRVVPCERPF